MSKDYPLTPQNDNLYGFPSLRITFKNYRMIFFNDDLRVLKIIIGSKEYHKDYHKDHHHKLLILLSILKDYHFRSVKGSPYHYPGVGRKPLKSERPSFIVPDFRFSKEFRTGRRTISPPVGVDYQGRTRSSKVACVKNASKRKLTENLCY